MEITLKTSKKVAGSFTPTVSELISILNILSNKKPTTIQKPIEKI